MFKLYYTGSSVEGKSPPEVLQNDLLREILAKIQNDESFEEITHALQLKPKEVEDQINHLESLGYVSWDQKLKRWVPLLLIANRVQASRVRSFALNIGKKLSDSLLAEWDSVETLRSSINPTWEKIGLSTIGGFLLEIGLRNALYAEGNILPPPQDLPRGQFYLWMVQGEGTSQYFGDYSMHTKFYGDYLVGTFGDVRTDRTAPPDIILSLQNQTDENLDGKTQTILKSYEQLIQTGKPIESKPISVLLTKWGYIDEFGRPQAVFFSNTDIRRIIDWAMKSAGILVDDFYEEYGEGQKLFNSLWGGLVPNDGEFWAWVHRHAFSEALKHLVRGAVLTTPPAGFEFWVAKKESFANLQISPFL
ncbi:MAG: hypothetical protein ACW976_06715 [Candidatus Ranarchaeia archaeon]